MRLLVDENVDVKIIGLLKKVGHDAVRTPAGTKNGAVSGWTRKTRVGPPGSRRRKESASSRSAQAFGFFRRGEEILAGNHPLAGL